MSLGLAANEPTISVMPDGGLQENFPHVASDIATGARAGKMRPMLLIGIGNTEGRGDRTGPTKIASDRRTAHHVAG